MIHAPNQNNCPIGKIIVFAFICAILSTCMGCGGSYPEDENECTIDGFTYPKNFYGPIPISENDCRNLVK